MNNNRKTVKALLPMPCQSAMEGVETMISKRIKISARNEQLDHFKTTSDFVLGDGGLYINKASGAKNAIYNTSKLSVNLDYIMWQAWVLSALTSVSVGLFEANGMHKESVRLATKSHPTYTTLHSRFYSTGRKEVSVHDLLKFDKVSLACLVQDDGAWNQNKDQSYYRFYICTESFSEAENKLLRDTIAEKLNVHADVVNYKTKHRLCFKGKQVDKLYEIVQPMLAPSFYYKFRDTPTSKTVESWITYFQDYDIVRTVLKNTEPYRNVLA